MAMPSGKMTKKARMVMTAWGTRKAEALGVGVGDLNERSERAR